MRVNLGLWPNLYRLLALLICVAAGLVVVMWNIPLFQQNERMRKEIQGLQGQTQREDEAIHRLETSVKALREDPKTVERLAREKLGYAKTGETVIYFEAPVTNSPLVTPSR